MKRILSIDGGGVRLALTLPFLVEVERQTGKLCRELFDMVAGTSAGAIGSSCIAAGIPAADILEFWQTDAPHVFNLSALETWPLRLLKGYAYDSQRIADVLKERLGPAASWSLNDSPVRILLCAAKVNQWPMYFVQDRPKNAKTTGKLSLIDCATASAAAPTYLSPWYVSPLNGELVGWCVDGGISNMANPAYHACVEAFVYDDFDPKDTMVISLGTGYSPDTQVNPPSGFVNTLSLVIDSLLFNAGIQQSQMVRREYPGIMRRFNWELPSAVDMADAGAIPQLVALGRKLAPQMDWKLVLGL